MVIDASVEFGKKFIRDNNEKTLKETDERLRVMGPAFIHMVGKALNEIKEEQKDGV